MSLDIALIDKELNESIIEMNWLRNQYGLIYWAADNVTPKIPKGKTLWYVINHWSYATSNNVNRKLFKQVVDAYWKDLQKLEKGYFSFNLSSFIQVVAPHFDHIELGEFGMIKAAKYNEDRTRIFIPMEMFAHHAFGIRWRNETESLINEYKEWFQELVNFADLLQDRKYRFYCSN